MEDLALKSVLEIGVAGGIAFYLLAKTTGAIKSLADSVTKLAEKIDKLDRRIDRLEGRFVRHSTQVE